VIELSDTEQPQKTRQQTISAYLQPKTEANTAYDDLYKRMQASSSWPTSPAV
jgi:hypothetical protein